MSDWISDVCSSDLLRVALVLHVGAVILVDRGTGRAIDTQAFVYGGLPAILAIVLHVVLRLRARDADPFVLPIATILTGLGMAEIYRIDIARNHLGWDASSTRQLAWSAIAIGGAILIVRSEEHTSELQSLMRISYAVFCLKKKKR